MPLVTLFSAPKAFTDPTIARMQRNAIRSWKALRDIDVLLIGHEPGLEEAARAIGVRNIQEVAVNSGGVPLISSMFEIARGASDSSMLGVINADIILTSDFVEVASQINGLCGARVIPDKFVMLSRRWDLDLEDEIDFDAGWQGRLEAMVRQQGRLHRATGSDLFVFPRACYPEIPDFAIGRAGWDNWMIYKARREGWPVIDATRSMQIIHQNHDYRHLPGARPHYDHPDTQRNTILAGGVAATRYTILDATDLLVAGRLQKPPFTVPKLLRRMELLLRKVFFFVPEASLEGLVRPRRWEKRIKRLFGRSDS